MPVLYIPTVQKMSFKNNQTLHTVSYPGSLSAWDYFIFFNTTISCFQTCMFSADYSKWIICRALHVVAICEE